MDERAPDGARADDGLLHAESVAALGAAVAEATELVTAAVSRASGPFSGAAPSSLVDRVAGADLDKPLAGLSEVLAEVRELYLDDAVWFHHPRYVAHLNCPIAVPAIAADVIASTVNSSMDTWDQSGGATLIERRLVDWVAARVGLGPAADGIFTSGGTASNLQAMLLAREQALPRAGGALQRLRIVASEAAHYSVVKSASVLGVGRDAVVGVATDEAMRMDPEALSRTLADLQAQDLVPMAVVATAGTTDFGSIDPLPSVAGLCRAHGVWLHVDAAYGGGLLVSPRHRDLLIGIEQADSVTVDFHKSFFQPVASSVLLVRDRETLGHATHHADYLNPRDADREQRPNQVDKSLQTTRRFDALKLWVTLRHLGPDRIGEMFETCLGVAEEAYALLCSRDDVEVRVPPQLSTLVFRMRPAGVDPVGAPWLVDRANREARDRLFESGAGAVAGTRVEGGSWLKFTLLNPATTVDDLAHVLDLLAGHAADVVSEESAA